jgi:methyl-accepting chemotaxis protein/aerotaxis receptor
MRVNEPITNHEIEMSEGQLLVSKTDIHGRITFANRDFVELSGFDREELLGAPHNIVRHPHMPKEAFADLWATLKQGRPWEGFVKNRRKDGDFYWVRANVTPVIEDGQTTGFVSIRSKPSRAEVMAAEKIYAEIRGGLGKKWRIDEGAALRTGLLPRLAIFASSIVGRLAMAAALLILIMAALGVFTFRGLGAAEEALREVYQDRAIPLDEMGAVRDLMRANTELVQSAAIRLLGGEKDPAAIDGILQQISANIAAISDKWQNYSTGNLAPADTALAQEFAVVRGSFVSDGLKPALALIKAGDGAKLGPLLTTVMEPKFAAAMTVMQKLTASQIEGSKQLYDAATDRWHRLLAVAIGLGLFALVAIIVAGFVVLRSIRRPLARFAEHFDAIARGDATHVIEDAAVPEFRRLTSLLRALRASLAYTTAERLDAEARTQTERQLALREMADRIETESADAVTAVGGRTQNMAIEAAQMAEAAGTMRGDSASVTQAAETALANIQAVASAAEELSASIHEISSQVAQGSAITQAAVADSRQTQETIAKLSQEVSKIGDIAVLIGDIASQTNLLALNATIEAARAGEAGKGFAVVANEVKSLANQTGTSVEEITRQISRIQGVTKSAVEAVTAIGGRITGIDEVSSSIAAAMEQQSAATAEISRSVSETSQAAQNVSELIGRVMRNAVATGDKADAVKAGAAEVSDAVNELREVVVRVVRTSTSDVNRREDPRFETDRACHVRLGHEEIVGNIVDISLGGAKIAGDFPEAVPETVALRVADHPRQLTGRIVHSTPSALHVKFEPGKIAEQDLAAISHGAHRLAAQ